MSRSSSRSTSQKSDEGKGGGGKTSSKSGHSDGRGGRKTTTKEDQSLELMLPISRGGYVPKVRITFKNVFKTPVRNNYSYRKIEPFEL